MNQLFFKEWVYVSSHKVTDKFPGTPERYHWFSWECLLNLLIYMQQVYIFELQNPSYDLRSSCNQFRREKIKTIMAYSPESARYFGPKMWELVPNNIKYNNSLSKFKKLIKSWKPEACSCRLCKTYIAQVVFI